MKLISIPEQIVAAKSLTVNSVTITLETPEGALPPRVLKPEDADYAAAIALAVPAVQVEYPTATVEEAPEPVKEPIVEEPIVIK